MAKKKKRNTRKKRNNERNLIIVFVLTIILLICLAVFFWYGDDNESTIITSPDGTTVMTGFEISTDSWCEQNPVFCGSEGLLDRAMCWMPSSIVLPAAGSGSCWAIATMEISWFHLNNDFSFLPNLRTLCDSVPSGISTYLAGIQQNRKAADNALGSLMNGMVNDKLDPADICEGMMKEISNGEPVMVVIVLGYTRDNQAEAAHGVVAYGYEESESEVTFIIADSNSFRPDNMSEELIYSKDADIWTYNASYHPHWYNLRIGFLKISSLGVPSIP